MPSRVKGARTVPTGLGRLALSGTMATPVWQDELHAPRWQDPATLGGRARSAFDRSAAVDKVIDAMHERIDQPFTLDEMARIAYLSRFYFNRVFREVTGLPPVRFHMALRMAAAKRLLMTTDMSVTDVCLEVGYQSLGTFTTHFHELVGMSPRELRRAASGHECAELADALARAQAATGTPAVEGEVLGPDDGGQIFVGLFNQPYPQGLPLACAALNAPGRYMLRTDARGTFHVAAAKFPPDDRPALVATAGRPVRLAPGRTSRRDLPLRAVRRTDPPILVALPAAPAAHDHGIDGHQPMPNAAGTLITQ